MSDNFPRMIAVTFQHPTPYFDDSYAVNSVNVGPYGDAIMQELIPEVEKRYRIIREPWARSLSGGSTGGWEALALQIFHPDFFGGTWSPTAPIRSRSPTSRASTSTRTRTRSTRTTDGAGPDGKQPRASTANCAMTSRAAQPFRAGQRHARAAPADSSTSGRRSLARSARTATSSRCSTSAPATSTSDVAQYWKENYDLLYYLEKNWTTLGPKLVDKLYFYAGDVDTYYLNNSTSEMELWMKTTENPHYEGFFMYGDHKPHCWSGPVSSAERLKEMAQLSSGRSRRAPTLRGGPTEARDQSSPLPATAQ